MHKLITFFLNTLILFFVCSVTSFGQVSGTNSWDKLSFPILSWLGPSSNIVNDTLFRDMIDAGFTINMSDLLINSPGQIITLAPTQEENLRMLDVAEKAGLKLIIVDSRTYLTQHLDSINYEKLDSAIAAYKNHKAFLGYYVNDEPSAVFFDEIAEIKEYLNKKDPEHLAYINLYPAFAYPSVIGAPSYEDYVSGYLAKVRPQILSFDIYCFYDGELRPMYFENLEIIRNAAILNNIPFWAFTLSTQHDLYDMPTEGQISFQLFCDLAYGAKGLQYFTYGYIPNLSILSPIDSVGNKTQIWTMAKNVNSEILHLSTVLKSLKSVDVYHSAPLPQRTHGLPESFYIKATGTIPMVIGYFKNTEGSPYVLLVNRKYDQNVSVTLSVSDSVKSIIEVSKKTGIELSALEADLNNSIKLDFKPGEGRLFRIQNKLLNVSLVFTIFPNPVNERLTISMTNQVEIKTIKIYSLNGKQLFLASVNSDQIEIDMSNFQDGIYLIKINTRDKTITRKIIKIVSH